MAGWDDLYAAFKKWWAAQNEVAETAAARQLRAAGEATGEVWRQYVVARMIVPLASFVAQQFVEAQEQTGPVFLEVAGKLIREVLGQEIDPAELKRLGAAEGIVAFGRRLGADLGPLLTSVVTPSADLDPDQARQAAETVLGTAAAFELDHWWDRTLLELLSLGQLSNLADFSEAIGGGFGITPLSRNVMRDLYRLTLREGLQVWANRTYTPQRLAISQVVDAYQQQLVDQDQALAALRDLGYSYERAVLLLNSRQADFTLEQTEQLWRLGTFDDGKLGEVVRRRGYGEVRGQLVADLLRRKRLLTLLEETADVSRRLYREGFVDGGALRELLREAHYRDDEIDVVLVREDLARLEERRLTKSEILAAYEGGTLDEADARAALRAQRYSDDTIDLLLATARRRLAPAEVVSALAAGRLTRGEALARLQQLGYSAADAELLLDLRTRTLSEGQIIDAVRRRLLPVDVARAKLRQLGFGAEETDLLLALGIRELSGADVQAALSRRLITPSEARARLRTLGYSDADAELFIGLRVVLLSSGQVLDAYEVGQLGRAETRARLEQLGFSPEDSDLVLRVFEARAAKRPPQPPPAP